MKSKHLASLLLSLSVITIALLVYLPTMAPTITWQHGGADSGELAAAVVTAGVAHPPGYPTYLLLGSLWLMLPLGQDVAYQLNLLSVVSAALAAALTANTIVLLAESLPKRPLYAGALFGGLSLTFAPLVWSQALITEVYALGLLMLSVVTYFFMAWYKKTALTPQPPRLDQSRKLVQSGEGEKSAWLPPLPLLGRRRRTPVEGGWGGEGWVGDFGGIAKKQSPFSSSSAPFYLILASLLFGLGLGVLPQLILLLPGAMWVYLSNLSNLSMMKGKAVKQVTRELCVSGLAVALGLSTYLLLPWRAAMQPRANWGDPVTLERFWQLVTASQYHHLAQRLTPEAWLSRFGEGIVLVGQNLGWVPLMVGLWALRFLWCHNRAVLGYLFSLIILTLCFRTSYFAIGNQVYLIPALYGLSILIGMGFASLLTQVQAKSHPIDLVLSLLMTIGLIWQGVNLMPQMDISHEYDAALFGQRTLNALPHNAIIVTERDEHTFPLWYEQALDQRLDIVVIDSRLLFYDWYQQHLTHHYPDLNPAAVRPGGLTALERPLYRLSGALGDETILVIK